MIKARLPLLAMALVFLVLTATGCASGPKFAGLEPVPAGKSDIYLFRKAKIFASGTSYDIFLDNTKVGTLLNGGYLRFTVAPGSHVIRAETSLIFSTAKRDTQIQVNAGERSFVALTIYTGTSGVQNTWGYALGETTAEFALRELPDLGLSN
jgi:hypothetical protein